MPVRLAVCAEMVFLDRPFIDRVRRIHELGFAVEMWDWRGKDIEGIVATGAQVTSMTGYISGRLSDPEGAEELLRTAEESVAVANLLGGPNLNLHGTGLGPEGLPVTPLSDPSGAEWITAADTLRRVAVLGEREGVTFVVENLNTEVDHPGVPFASAADVLALVSAAESPHLRMNLDLYHAQIGEGNLIELVRRAAPWLGEVQVADVPGRCEPGTGEINYPAIARALAEVGYEGVVGLEGWASADSETALERFREAFTV
ncbi:MAG: TIM barrel protein [Euzebya tangerina]|nr:TIM barrel protein [Euzebya tangerina]